MTLADVRIEHPLAMTTAEEVERVRATLAEAGLLGETVRFAFLLPEEPPKAEVLAFTEGDAVDRRFRVALLDLATGRSWDTVVSATHGEVVSSRELDPATDGQPPIIDSEFMVVEDILNADAGWLAALEKRGIEPASVRAAPLSAGVYDYPEERGRRILRSFGFVQEHEKDHCWAHPIDGLVAYVDLTTRSVDRIIDAEALPLPVDVGQLRRPRGARAAAGHPAPDLDHPAGRPVVHDRGQPGAVGQVGPADRVQRARGPHAAPGRASTGGRSSTGRRWPRWWCPTPTRRRCGSGRTTSTTASTCSPAAPTRCELGCDCLGDIAYLDAVIADDLGAPKTIQNAICVHEEDFGVLWKHSDLFTGSAETRRQRRMVFSFFTADRQLRLRLLLVPLPRRHDPARGQGDRHRVHGAPGAPTYASPVAPGLAAPYHQHLFSARLDMTVDGVRNAVEEVEAVARADGAGQPVRQRVHPGPHAR